MFAKKKFTFLIIPHKSGKRSLEFSVNSLFVTFFSVFLVGLVVMFGTTLYLSTKISNITVQYYQQESRNEKVLDQLDLFKEKTENLKSVILSLKERDQEIRRLLGLRPNRNYTSVSLKKN